MNEKKALIKWFNNYEWDVFGTLTFKYSLNEFDAEKVLKLYWNKKDKIFNGKDILFKTNDRLFKTNDRFCFYFNRLEAIISANVGEIHVVWLICIYYFVFRVIRALNLIIMHSYLN